MKTKILLGSLLLCMATQGSSLAQISMVTVGNAGNSADSTGYGSVGYEYQIGTYEVTNSQYAAFLNAVAQSDPNNLYKTDMGTNSHGGITRTGIDGAYVYTVKSGYGDRPVNFVSFGDTVRFANWLTNSENGQGSSTETGSYDLSNSLSTVTRLTIQTGQTVQYFVASEDEWYKAAYYDPTLNGGLGGYWAYPTQSNTAPTATGPTASPNSANYNSQVGVLTNGGSYTGSFSFYGTFDQEGNVSEITDTLIGVGGQRVRRGSHYTNATIGSGFRSGIEPTSDTEVRQIGFRVVMIAVPEPSSALLLGGAAIAFGLLPRRRKSSIQG